MKQLGFSPGMSAPAGSALDAFNNEPNWIEHARSMDTNWAKLEHWRLSRIRLWSAAVIQESKPVVYYMFSGPDYLYVDAFFPNASTYVLCGTEAVGALPGCAATTAKTLPAGLHNLEASLHSAVNFSFFITKDMRKDLQIEEFGGTLPLLLMFLARSNKHVVGREFRQP